MAPATKTKPTTHRYSLTTVKSPGMEGWQWFQCSCGASGSKADDEEHARAEYRAHVRRALAQEAKARAEAAGPELLAAAKAMLGWVDGEKVPSVNPLGALRAVVAKAEGK